MDGLASWSVVKSGVRYNWRTAVAVALGVAIATSVIVGALLVGDSMRGSLRELTVERLGRIDSVIAPGGFFSGNDVAESIGVAEEDVAAVLLFDRAVIEAGQTNDTRRAGSVQVIGCDSAFWKLDVSDVAPAAELDDESIVLTQTLAADLGVNVGDQVTVRLPVEQAVPADSPLGRRDVQTEGIPRLKVVEIIPDRGLARFSLVPSQATPRNVFLSRDLIASVLDREGKANVVLSSVPIDVEAMQVDLGDLGLQVDRVTQRFDGEVIYDYYHVTSDRLMIDSVASDMILDALPPGSVTPASTYLANAIERVDDDDQPTVTYSTITAMESSPLLPLDYEVDQDESDGVPDGSVPMVINSWLADRLQAQPGTRLRVAYYEPEVENGKEIERSFDAYVTQVVPITQPAKPFGRRRVAQFDQPPTRYNDPNLTPTVPGVTDQDSMSDWDTPFPLTRTVPPEDDQYYRNYRLTPKAFIPLADGIRLFGSRFGETTGLRIQTDVAQDVDQLRSMLRSAAQSKLPELGWNPRSIREAQLAASRGTTPFDGLFLALSFFVIFAAVMLIAMLFRLGLVARSRELGTLMALGLTKKQVSGLFLREGLIIATLGVVLGVAGGIAYAFVVLAALRTFWVGAVTVPFLTFHATPASLLIGASIGLLIGLVTVGWTLRSMLKNETVTLLRGRDSSDQVVGGHESTKPANWLRTIAVGLFVLAFVAGVIGAMSGGQTAAGSFVGGGMLLLIAILIFVYDRLRRFTEHGVTDRFSLTRLARSNSTRAPLRSTLTIGLMATASFLIVAITAFQLQPTDEGTGGFDLVAESAQPLYQDLSDQDVQDGLLGPDADQVSDATIVSFRVRSGQDASCNNLYQATEPTVMGVPENAAEKLDQFRFYASAETESETPSAWSLLDRGAAGTEEDPIPLILDQNTAMWSLQMVQGIGEQKTFMYDNQPITFEVVGLLENSLLQGRLMIGEANFLNTFPEVTGYRYTLVDTADETIDDVSRVLETRLSDVGFDVSIAARVLSGMMAVQNTYLRTFQSLGGLGLLLGTVGLAIAQLRNVLERRSELALMRAIGFTRGRLAWMVMGETASLLVLGIGCGVLCAVVAVLPYAATKSVSPPIVEPVLLVFGIVVFGLVAGLIAAVKVVRMQLLESLRGT